MSGYCIYEVESTRFVRIFRNGHWVDAEFPTLRGLNLWWNRLMKEGKIAPLTHASSPLDIFHKSIEKTRMTRNLLNPAAGEFPIPVNTPLHMDPGSETYHST